MIRKLIQKFLSLFKKKREVITAPTADVNGAEYALIERLKRNAFHTPNPELRDKLLVNVVKFEEKPLTKIDAVNSEFNTINWQALDFETKEKLIKIAREAIANEISSRPTPPVAYMTTIKNN